MFRRSFMLMVGSALLAALVVGAMGRVLLGMYGASFVRAYPVLLVILVTTLISASTVSVNTTLTAFSRVWSVTVVALFWAIVFAISLIAWRTYGAMGLALAYLVAYLAQALITIPLAARALHSRATE